MLAQPVHGNESAVMMAGALKSDVAPCPGTLGVAAFAVDASDVVV